MLRRKRLIFQFAFCLLQSPICNSPFHVKRPSIPPMPSNLLRLKTPRLELIAAKTEMLEADLAGRKELAEALGVEVPDAWPPINWEREPIEYLIHWMQKRPDAPGWFAWYCTLILPSPFGRGAGGEGSLEEGSQTNSRPAQVPGLNVQKEPIPSEKKRPSLAASASSVRRTPPGKRLSASRYSRITIAKAIAPKHFMRSSIGRSLTPT